MELRDIALRVGVFLVVVLAATVVTGVGAIPGPGGQANQSAPLTVESHQPESILATPPAESGEVAVDSTTTGKTIVIDQSHNNSVSPDTISPFVQRLVAAGHSIQFYTDAIARNHSLNTTLRDADAFVVVAPEEQYGPDERQQVEQFAADGGRVLLVNEPQIRTADESDPPATPLTNLAGTFGLGFDAGYLYDLTQYNTNHRDIYAYPSGAGALTEGVDRVTLHTARPVTGGSAVYTTNQTTALSETRREQSYTVLARQDNVVALGDRSLLEPEYVYTDDNEVLVGNVIDFLVSGDRSD